MCADYIGAGLPAERFWQITPRLYLTEMKGAAIRMARERGLVWDAAYLPNAKKPPSRAEYVADPRARRVPSWQEQAAAWQAYVVTKTGGA